MISEQGLQEFMELYERKYGILLPRQEAFDMFSKLVRIVQIAYDPIAPEITPYKTKNDQFR